jgi:hypothetical protein
VLFRSSVVEAKLRDFATQVSKRTKQRRPEPVEIKAAAATATEAEHTTRAGVDLLLNADELATVAALEQVQNAMGAKLNDPEELKRQEADVDSDYNRALGNALGVSPAVAKLRREQYAVKVSKLVQVHGQELVQKFEYHCPFCLRINSPSCAYIGYPLDWKIAHSRRKPYTVVVNTTKTVQVDEVEMRDLPGVAEELSALRSKEWFQ